MSYTFGDSERAAQRLALVARVFEPASYEFLAQAGRRAGALAVDLGCGPGHTTQLLACALASARTVGLDASEAYVEAARTRAGKSADSKVGRRAASRRRAKAGPCTGSDCEFVRHDVRVAPFPTGAADTLYARFLVTHLADPLAAIGVFVSQLAPGGRLLLDEVEWIHSDAEPFRLYLSLVEAVLRSQGQCLYVGPRIDRLAAADARTCRNELRELAVDPRDAAAMFSLNWETLREHAAVTERTTEASRENLTGSLAALRDGEARPVPITWGLRQVAIEA